MSLNRAGFWSVVLLSVVLGGDVAAQVSAPQAQGEEALVATDPIRCWWRTGGTSQTRQHPRLDDVLVNACNEPHPMRRTIAGVNGQSPGRDNGQRAVLR